MVKNICSAAKSHPIHFFSGTCACASGSSTLVKVQSHADFLDGALLEHPAIKGDYSFSAATDQHPRGFFVKAAGKSLTVSAF